MKQHLGTKLATEADIDAASRIPTAGTINMVFVENYASGGPAFVIIGATQADDIVLRVTTGGSKVIKNSVEGLNVNATTISGATTLDVGAILAADAGISATIASLIAQGYVDAIITGSLLLELSQIGTDPISVIIQDPDTVAVSQTLSPMVTADPSAAAACVITIPYTISVVLASGVPSWVVTLTPTGSVQYQVIPTPVLTTAAA